MIAGTDTLSSTPASYTLVIPSSLATDWELGPSSTLDLLLAALDERPRPREAKEVGHEGGGRENEIEKPSARDDSETSDNKEDKPVDLTIELSDASGTASRVRLSTYGVIRKPLNIKVLRRNDDQVFGKQWELVLQSYSIPLSDFVDGNSALDPGSIQQVKLIFDQTEAGTVVVDDIGFSKMDCGFLQSGSQKPGVC